MWILVGWCFSQMHTLVYMIAEVIKVSFWTRLSNQRTYDQFISILLIPQFKESIHKQLFLYCFHWFQEPWVFLDNNFHMSLGLPHPPLISLRTTVSHLPTSASIGRWRTCAPIGQQRIDMTKPHISFFHLIINVYYLSIR